jgi:DNA-binding transcriptional MerR regulator
MYYTIEKLAEVAGVSKRKIRFYIQKGLLPSPEGKGRGAYYTDNHLRRLRKILKLADEGMFLDHMADYLDDEASYQEQNFQYEELREDKGHYGSSSSSEDEEEVTSWKHLKVGADIELNFKEGALSEEQIILIKKLINGKQ